MTQLLSGDIGGTKTILRLAQVNDDDVKNYASHKVPIETLHEARFPSGDYPEFVPMVKEFLAAAAEKNETVNPVSACFAIAGPVVNNTSQLTNLSWFLRAEFLAGALGIEHVQLINDFEAIGYGVLGLKEEDIYELQAGEPNSSSPMAVLGAGTGLGQGFLLPAGDEYVVFPSEGGHVDFAPQSELEFQLRKYLIEKHCISRVSEERVVSGMGIISIYQFLRDRQYASESEKISTIMNTWESNAGNRSELEDPAAAISKAATDKTDLLSQKTMEIFIRAYGSEAGNISLKFLPRGGLYIAGGVTAKNLDLITGGEFMFAFKSKGRVSHLLDEVPVRVVLNQHVGLIGATIKASRTYKEKLGKEKLETEKLEIKA
ncbi:MAG: glucokinase [Cyanobacteria bacterium J06634_5]